MPAITFSLEFPQGICYTRRACTPVRVTRYSVAEAIARHRTLPVAFDAGSHDEPVHMIKLSRTTTGTLLFLVDAILLLLSWPILVWTSRPSMADMVHPLVDARGVVYPLANLLLLFAMGLYRRGAHSNNPPSLRPAPPGGGAGAA